MINPNQRNLHKKRIPPNTCINENLPHKERSSPPRNEGQFYTTIKTPKPSQTKVRIIFQVWHTRVVEILSNLTFKGHLASTTPILSVRSSLFLFRRFYLERVRTVWLTNDFWHHHNLMFKGFFSFSILFSRVFILSILKFSFQLYSFYECFAS